MMSKTLKVDHEWIIDAIANHCYQSNMANIGEEVEVEIYMRKGKERGEWESMAKIKVDPPPPEEEQGKIIIPEDHEALNKTSMGQIKPKKDRRNSLLGSQNCRQS